MSAPVTAPPSASDVALPLPVDLAEIVTEVWESLLLPAEVIPVDPVSAIEQLRAVEAWSASIDVRGPAPLRVTTVLPREGARALTRHLLLAADPSTDDVTDALGELVNIVGGSLKSLMPAPSVLSLPVATTGAPAYDGTAGGCAVQTTWAGHPVVVTVHDPSSTAPLTLSDPQGAPQ